MRIDIYERIRILKIDNIKPNFALLFLNLMLMLYDLLNNEKIIHSDETTLVVTKKDEENQNRKKSYVYVYTSSYYSGNQIRIYDFQESRKIDQTAKGLSTFSGVIHCDDYSGYDTFKKNNSNIKLQRCWAHVRRRYADIVKALNSKAKKRVLHIKYY